MAVVLRTPLLAGLLETQAEDMLTRGPGMPMFVFALEEDAPRMIAERIYHNLLTRFPGNKFALMTGPGAGYAANTIMSVVESASEDGSGTMINHPVDHELTKEVQAAFADLLVEAKGWRLS